MPKDDQQVPQSSRSCSCECKCNGQVLTEIRAVNRRLIRLETRHVRLLNHLGAQHLITAQKGENTHASDNTPANASAEPDAGGVR